MSNQVDTHWRNSMKPARFFFLDARAALPFVLVMLHLRWYTLVIAGVTTIIFYILEKRGLGFISALRAFRVWLVTRKRPAVTHANMTRMVDFAYEGPLDAAVLPRTVPDGVTQSPDKSGANMVNTKEDTKSGKVAASASAKGKARVAPAAKGKPMSANQIAAKLGAKTVKPAASPKSKN